MTEEEITPKRVVSLDTRLKMREKKLGHAGYWKDKKRGALSPEVRAKISATLRGRKITEEHRKNMIEGKRLSNQRIKEQLAEYKLLKESQNQNVQSPILSGETPKTPTEEPENFTGIHQ